ncbi:hypothetical protein LTR56_006514 [Elasticomyces elasticus]|nr:hypothetical protein LTR22_022061 [Elasticomyces elasticus]KAK3649927.1 hypothetical protein LTR56_006514 [Elasticomyces elasticus]KAK4931681.1 hypothetical protein LTR49_001746 [Elasticomyces elasticus]KAK5740726.1 hypothetical protein LTS12_024856 [Elasticomyces elasticus]
MAAAVSAPMIDLKATGTYNIRLGDSIAKGAGSVKQWASVRYNHKPALDKPARATSSIKSNGDHDCELVLKDDEGEYGYAGTIEEIGHTYVLVLRGGGESTEAVLEELSSSHAFNLTSTPEEKDAGKLKDRYAHIVVEQDDQTSLLGDGAASEIPADPSNPFDYRHFLKAAAQSKVKQVESGTSTPVTHARPASSTPLVRPAKKAGTSALIQQKKRKAPVSAADRADAKRVKPSDTAASVTKSSKIAETAPPRIRVDRKASVRKSSYDESGELILENDDPPSSKLPSARSAMAMALNGQLTQSQGGPISLRSAASSPASHMESPAPDDIDELGDGFVDDDEEGYLDEQDEDADVEDLELPSPATVHKPSVSAATVTGGDDEDDLDAQLAAAMAEEAMGDGEAMDEEVVSEEE